MTKKAVQTKTVLLVDDDLDFLEQQKSLLEGAGFKVVTAESLRQAQELLKTLKPDLAILDLMLEYQDAGFTLCYLIKKQNPQTPVILVTGVQSETGLGFDAATAEERSWLKADVMLAKPVRFEQLQSEIERLLK